MGGTARRLAVLRAAVCLLAVAAVAALALLARGAWDRGVVGPLPSSEGDFSAADPGGSDGGSDGSDATDPVVKGDVAVRIRKTGGRWRITTSYRFTLSPHDLRLRMLRSDTGSIGDLLDSLPGVAETTVPAGYPDYLPAGCVIRQKTAATDATVTASAVRTPFTSQVGELMYVFGEEGTKDQWTLTLDAPDWSLDIDGQPRLQQDHKATVPITGEGAVDWVRLRSPDISQRSASVFIGLSTLTIVLAGACGGWLLYRLTAAAGGPPAAAGPGRRRWTAALPAGAVALTALTAAAAWRISRRVETGVLWYAGSYGEPYALIRPASAEGLQQALAAVDWLVLPVLFAAVVLRLATGRPPRPAALLPVAGPAVALLALETAVVGGAGWAWHSWLLVAAAWAVAAVVTLSGALGPVGRRWTATAQAAALAAAAGAAALAQLPDAGEWPGGSGLQPVLGGVLAAVLVEPWAAALLTAGGRLRAAPAGAGAGTGPGAVGAPGGGAGPGTGAGSGTGPAAGAGAGGGSGGGPGGGAAGGSGGGSGGGAGAGAASGSGGGAAGGSGGGAGAGAAGGSGGGAGGGGGASAGWTRSGFALALIGLVLAAQPWLDFQSQASGLRVGLFGQLSGLDPGFSPTLSLELITPAWQVITCGCAVLLLLMLRRHGRRPGAGLTPAARIAVAALVWLASAAALMGDPTQRLGHWAAPGVAVAGLLCTLWLVPAARGTEAVRLHRVSRAAHVRLVQALVRTQLLAQGRRRFVRDSAGRLADGTLTPTAWDAQWRTLGGAAVGDPAGQTARLRRAALGTPGGSAPWDNGVAGALIASLFALPWLVSMWWRSPVQPGLPMLITVNAQLAVWAAAGFGYGYLYPWLRGRDPMTKAAAATAATLPVQLLIACSSFNGSPEDLHRLNQLAGVGLIVTGQCVLVGLGLGLAWEARLVRAAGLPWNHVRDFRRASSLVVPSTTILVAAVTTLATVFASSWATSLTTPPSSSSVGTSGSSSAGTGSGTQSP
jgi:hypothetical protein